MQGRAARFEMRRFEMLSNTIFGVAMTLLAYELPKTQLSGAAPDWAAIWTTYESPLLALLLSFIIAGLFWYSHQRRLAYAPEASRSAVIGNLLFLLSIIVLPASTGLYGRYPRAVDIIALYGFHLAIISALNLILWMIAALPRQDWHALGAPAFAALVFLAAAAWSLVDPVSAQYLWCLSFAAPAVGAWFDRRAR